ncbi:hypothetical protein BW31_01397 [Pantoea agglomerans]|uniref:hypothetical protein n=1 Tax=Enterobacter agglomerans TaxID=549 RepID=UPI000446C461|nr:hypothetical protein [Pantoea agglomerans]EZI34354.1 hypothetical protein BW31_01397 [Pantoea agglomerans]
MSEVKRYSHNGLRGMLEHKAGRYVSYERYAALNAERDVLAAENAIRGEIIVRLIGQYSAAGYHAVQNSLNPAQSLLYDAMQVLKQPATDAYLNSVRAEGVEMVKAHPAISLCALTHVCEEIAAQLRAGKGGEK